MKLIQPKRSTLTFNLFRVFLLVIGCCFASVLMLRGLRPSLAAMAPPVACTSVSFSPAVHYSLLFSNNIKFPVTSALGDFNGDGKLDIVTGTFGDTLVSVFLNNGTGGFGAPTSYTMGASPAGVAVEDVNGDSKLDIISADGAQGNGELSVRLGDGSGGFGARTRFALNGAGASQPQAVAAADFNGDGKRDLVTANFESDNASVLLNNCTAPCTTPSFAAAVFYPTGQNPGSVAIGDVNGDGKLDLAVSNHNSSNVSVLLGNGNGTFQAAVNFSPAGQPQEVALGDLNGDGKLDLLSANRNQGQVAVLLNTCASPSCSTPSFGTATSFNTDEKAISITAGDFNGDGKLDVATSSNTLARVAVLVGDGMGGLGAPINFAVYTGQQNLVAGDLNADNKLDLVVTTSDEKISVLLSNCQPNQNPTINALATNRTLGAGASSSQIATATDNEDAEDALKIEISSDGVTFGNSATRNNVAVTLTDSNAGATGINPDATGKVFASVAANCGATQASFTLRVTDSGNLSATTTLTVTVTIVPSTITPLANQTACQGGTATFTAGATGTGPFTYVWKKGATVINTGVVTNSTGSTLTLTNVQPGDAGTYVVEISDACSSTGTQSASLTVNPSPVATAGPAQTICQNGTTSGLGGNTPATMTAGVWTSNSGGTFSNSSAPNATWTAPANFTGVATLTWTVSSTASPACATPQTATVQVTVNGNPVAIAGNAQTICQTQPTTGLGGNTPPFATAGLWSSNSGGSFSPNASTPNATWTPPSNFVGSALLTWTVSSTASTACGTQQTATVPVTVNANPVATVGAAQTICQTQTTLGLGGNTPPLATAGLWISNSGGSFTPNATTPNATWTPPANFSGIATLTWTVSSTAITACGTPQTATLQVTVNANPVATVGNAQTIIQGTTTNGLGGNIPSLGTAGSWTSDSGGSFSPNATTPNATWTPPASFIGTAQLTWAVSSTVPQNCGTPQTASLGITVICPSITISPATLDAAPAGTAYSQQLTVSPAGSYSFSLVLGNLPSGLTLNPTTGLISGLTSGIGTFNFTVKAQSALGGCESTQAYTLVLNCPTIALTPSLPAPTVNVAYSQTVAATPATGSYSYAVTAGALPAGLTLNSATGVISGTPTAGGAYHFTLRATRFGSCTGSQSYSGTISCPTITLACPSCSSPGVLPNGKVSTLYARSLAATPSATYSYSVTAGALPPGLSLTGGTLSGRPTAAGTYNFTVRAQGSGGCSGSQAYTLTVTPATLASKPNQTDFDGDSKSDIWSYRAADGRWLIQRSSDNTIAFARLGSSNEIAVPADYDGDGKTDAAVFNAAKSRWQITQSSDGVTREERFGVSDAQAFAADFDGDGKADLAVRSTQGEWQIKQSSDGEVIVFSFGNADDQTVIGDFDGDGWADVAVYPASQRLVLMRQSGDGAIQDLRLQTAGGALVAADFDGDGVDEFVFWSVEKGTLQYRRSSDQQEQQLNIKGQLLLLGDFDGDGLSDCASRWGTSWLMRLSSTAWE